MRRAQLTDDCRAKVVIGDVDVAGAQKTVDDINATGGYDSHRPVESIDTDAFHVSRKAVSLKCNVTIWEDQVALFELAMSQYGAVDVVVRTTYPSSIP